MRGFAVIVIVLIVCGVLATVLLGAASLALHARIAAEHAGERAELRFLLGGCAESARLMLRSGADPEGKVIRMGKDACLVNERPGSADRQLLLLSINRRGIFVAYELVVDGDFSTISLVETVPDGE